MARRGSRKLKTALGLAAAALLLAATHVLWMRAMGRALVHEDGPAQADIAVVLAGDQWGNRVLKGGEMAREGYVPLVLVSGIPYYDTTEAALAVAFAVHHGDPQQWFVAFPHHATSTREEAETILPELVRRNAHSFLLVTSDYHTARAGRIWRAAIRRAGVPLQMRVVAASDRYFRADSWWKSREGRKIVFYEWLKTVTGAVGI